MIWTRYKPHDLEAVAGSLFTSSRYFYAAALPIGLRVGWDLSVAVGFSSELPGAFGILIFMVASVWIAFGVAHAFVNRFQAAALLAMRTAEIDGTAEAVSAENMRLKLTI